MRGIVLSIIVCIIFSLVGCHQDVDPIKKHTQDVQKAKGWFLGRWKLVEVVVQLPNPTIPNVNLVVNENQIELLQDGKRTDLVNYEITSINNELRITTNAQLRENNWYVRDPSLYINKKRMFLDLGKLQMGQVLSLLKRTKPVSL